MKKVINTQELNIASSRLPWYTWDPVLKKKIKSISQRSSINLMEFNDIMIKQNGHQCFLEGRQIDYTPHLEEQLREINKE